MFRTGSRSMWTVGVLAVLMLLTACGSPARPVAPGSSPEDTGHAAPAAQPRTLRLVTRLEAPDLAPKSSEAGGGNEQAKRLFNAALAVIDAKVIAHPYLAE